MYFERDRAEWKRSRHLFPHVVITALLKNVKDSKNARLYEVQIELMYRAKRKREKGLGATDVTTGFQHMFDCRHGDVWKRRPVSKVASGWVLVEMILHPVTTHKEATHVCNAGIQLKSSCSISSCRRLILSCVLIRALTLTSVSISARTRSI